MRAATASASESGHCHSRAEALSLPPGSEREARPAGTALVPASSIGASVLVGYRDMPLIDRSDSLLTIVDTQPGFFDHAKMTDEERASAAATVSGSPGWLDSRRSSTCQPLSLSRALTATAQPSPAYSNASALTRPSTASPRSA